MSTLRTAALVVVALAASSLSAQEERREDLLTLARGVVPVVVAGDSQPLGVGTDQALQVIDGNGGGFGLTPKPGNADTRIVLVYELPASTTFTSFAVPNVLETPSPSQTFIRTLEIAGSMTGPEGPFDELASMTLSTHSSRGETTEFPAAARAARWLQVTLGGGVRIERDSTFLEFTELSGFGTQEAVPLSTAFTGRWRGRGVALELRQEGVRVSGCYDGEGELSGIVSGNVLTATGKTRTAGIPSTFVLTLGADGNVVGVRSTNGAPFRSYAAESASGAATECAQRPVAPLGCGATVHGIQFDYDSAAFRRESDPIFDALFAGLSPSTANAITVIGHTSSEGAEGYNDDLSERRASAVVDALVARGVERGRITAAGRGEREPIADNASEAGRVLNRRVEIDCR